MSNYAIFGGAGYFTGATLGNLLTINKLRIVSKNVKLTTSGYIWTQADNTQREFGILHQQSLGIKYNYGSATAQTLLTTAEMTAIFGTYEPSVASFGVEFDLIANTFEVFVNGVSRKGPAPLIKGTGRLDGTLFRIGARSNTGIAGDTSGAAILPAGSWVGDTDIYINDVLVRRYIMPSSGTTVPESVSGAILTQRGTWPSDDSEWGSIVDPQGFTVSQSSMTAGATITGTYTAWPTAPDPSLVFTDSAANTLTLTPAIVGGSGDGTWSATIPALPSAGADVELLKFGATTVSFAGFTAKAGPTLQVAATQTLATLAADFDDYVFQGWVPQPSVGDQLVTVTAEGIFNSNGDYTFYAEGVYPVWYVDGTGQVFGRTIDTSGLNDPELLESSAMVQPMIRRMI